MQIQCITHIYNIHASIYTYTEVLISTPKEYLPYLRVRIEMKRITTPRPRAWRYCGGLVLNQTFWAPPPPPTRIMTGHCATLPQSASSGRWYREKWFDSFFLSICLFFLWLSRLLAVGEQISSVFCDLCRWPCETVVSSASPNPVSGLHLSINWIAEYSDTNPESRSTVYQSSIPDAALIQCPILAHILCTNTDWYSS